MKIIKFMLCGAILLAATAAQAVPITVNPGAYQGKWSLVGEHPAARTGVQTVDFAPGSHVIHIALYGALNIDIAADGTVTSNSPVLASGGASAVTFNTVNVFVDPVNYLGTWYIQFVTQSGNNRNAQSVAMVPGISYFMDVAGPINGLQNHIQMTVAADGAVTSSIPEAAIGGQGTWTFKNVTIQMDTGGYAGSWGLQRVFKHYYNQPAFTAPVDTVVVPGVEYYVNVAHSASKHVVLGGADNVIIAVDAVGNITSQRPASMVGSGNLLTFQTAVVTVDPQAFVGRWVMSHVTGRLIGAKTISLVKNITYFMYPNGVSNPIAGNNGSIRIDMDAQGNLTSSWPASIVATGNTLTFNNVIYNVDPVDYTGTYYLTYATDVVWVSGPQQLVGVPDWRYKIQLAGQSQPLNEYFSLDASGNVTSEAPNSYMGDGTTNTLTFVTMPIVLDTATYTGYMSFTEVFNVPGGPATYIVVPGLQYKLFVANNYYAGNFLIEEPCQVTGFPQLFTRTADSTTFDASTWNWSCPVVAVNNPPVADAGAGQNIYLGQMAYLNGAASSDPDGDVIASYTWTFDSAPVGSAFADPYASLNGVTPSFTPDLIGDYMLSLVVNDGSLNSAAATTLISVNLNQPPVATASSDVYTGVVPLTVNFDASASYDPEGGALTYSWNFADPTTGVNNVSALPNPGHSFNTAGTYTVLVDVIDDFGNVTQASVDIIATDPVVTPPPGGDTGGSNELDLIVHEAKVDYGKKGKVKGKVSVKAGFINTGIPAADDRISVSLDGVVLLDVPFSEFKAEDEPGEYEYKGKKLKTEINFTKSTIKVKRHKMVLSGIDNSNGVDVEVSIGSLSGFENIEMKAKHDDHEGKRKLSYKNKQYDD